MGLFAQFSNLVELSKPSNHPKSEFTQEQLAQKKQIKQIIVSSYLSTYSEYDNIYKQKKGWTTIEQFNTAGKIIRRVQTDSSSRKIEHRFFHKKKYIKVKTIEYTWKPLSKRLSNEPDTVYKKSKAEYNLEEISMDKKSKHKHYHKPDEYIYDNLGRIKESAVTHLYKGCDRVKSYYKYGENGKIKTIKTEVFIHENHQGESIIDFFYNSKNQLVTVIQNDKAKEITTTYTYLKNGLKNTVKEETQETYLGGSPHPKFKVFKYKYLYH
jgi:hypothetical protein